MNMKKHLTSSAMIMALSFAGASMPATQAAAGNNAGAAIVGALIGGAIVAGTMQNQRRNNANAAAASAQRTENRAVQTALNYFEFPAGTPDGVFGRRTRAAISEYQAFMGFPVTGELTEFQKDFLLTSHQRAELGGAETSRIILTDPMGSRALLVAFFDQQMGGGGDLGAGGLGMGNTLQANGLGTDVGADGDNMGYMGASDPSNALPVFVTSPEPSMNALCVSGLQPDSVEAEFCSLRAYALAQGDRLAAGLQGTSREQVLADCQRFAEVLVPYINMLPSASPAAMKAELRSWVENSGSSVASLDDIATVCLGAGYGADDATIALASVATFVGIDKVGYEELLGYHLALGFGFEGQDHLNQAVLWLDDVSMAYADGRISMTGESGLARTPMLIGFSNALRGLPMASPTNPNSVMPAFGTDALPEDTVGGGFFSSGASN